MARHEIVSRKPTPEGGRLSYAGLWMLAVAIVLAAMLPVVSGGGTSHPEPRPGVDARRVAPACRYAGHLRTMEVYRHAARMPAVLDGLYCYCRCRRHSGHYSLLDCFANDHAARCDICMSEASLAARMAAAGKTLKQIRHAIDGVYGG
jgi:hypothetical protein